LTATRFKPFALTLVSGFGSSRSTFNRIVTPKRKDAKDTKERHE
jgi:hypothetical protein